MYKIFDLIEIEIEFGFTTPFRKIFIFVDFLFFSRKTKNLIKERLHTRR
jgi:hypothetical protein